MGEKQGITPLIVARSQLLTAIDLFFADRDPISVQALAGNARELLEGLCRLAGVEPLTELMLRDHPNKERRDIYAAVNLYRNCFKHLGSTEEDRLEDQAVLDQFDDTKNEYLLYVCVADYSRLRRAMPVPLQVFQAWFCALHAELLKLGKLDMYLRAFPGIQNLSRTEQKRMAVAQIIKCHSDGDLLSDPQTEPMEISA